MTTSDRPQVWGRIGTVSATVAVLTLVTVALLGPSAASPELVGAGPSRHLPIDPPDAVATFLMWFGLAAATLAVVAWWIALRSGWQPVVRRVVAGGFVGAAALAFVPPLGSNDVLSYGAYGRMVVLGLDPYTTTINDLIARGDVIGLTYQGAWPDVPAVYGPVAVGLQGLVSAITGTSMRWFVLLMQLACLAVFMLTTWILLKAATSESGRRRVALLWAANPLLMYLVVNSAHIDGVAVVFGLAALVVVSRHPAVAGALVALAVGTKVSYALFALALVFALRRTRRELLTLCVSGVVVGGLIFAPFVPQILHPLRVASTYLARESVWWWASQILEPLVGSADLSRVLSLAAWVLMIVLVWRMRLLVPSDADRVSVQNDALRAAAVLSAAWLLSSTYALAWYDVMAWAPLLLLPASAFDLIVLARTSSVAIGYAPGVVARPLGWLGNITAIVRSGLAPLTSWILVLTSLVAPVRLRPPQPAADPLPTSSR